jgi:transcriptional regulator of acetoin/glycerol metabolism
VLAEGSEITERDLPESMFRNRLLLPGPDAPPLAIADAAPVQTLAHMEKEHISRVLQQTDFNYTDASKKLGISRSTLWRKIKEYTIETK